MNWLNEANDKVIRVLCERTQHAPSPGDSGDPWSNVIVFAGIRFAKGKVFESGRNSMLPYTAQEVEAKIVIDLTNSTVSVVANLDKSLPFMLAVSRMLKEILDFFAKWDEVSVNIHGGDASVKPRKHE